MKQVKKYIVLEIEHRPSKLTSSKLTKIVKTILDNGFELSILGNRVLYFVKGFGVESKGIGLKIEEVSNYTDKLVIRTDDEEMASRLEKLISELKIEN